MGDIFKVYLAYLTAHFFHAVLCKACVPETDRTVQRFCCHIIGNNTCVYLMYVKFFFKKSYAEQQCLSAEAFALIFLVYEKFP